MQGWRWWERSDSRAPCVAVSKLQEVRLYAKCKLQSNEANFMFSNGPAHQSGNKWIPLTFPKLLPWGAFRSTCQAETLGVRSVRVRGSKECLVWARDFKINKQVIVDCKILLSSQLQSHDPMKSHSKIYELVLVYGFADFKSAQVLMLASKYMTEYSNAFLKMHQTCRMTCDLSFRC